MSMQEFEIFVRVVDLSWGINKQVLAALHFLAYSEIEGCQPPEVVQTVPMLMDGNMGVCLMFKRVDSVAEPWLLVHVGEDKDSSDILVRNVTVRALDDPKIGPTYKDFKSARVERVGYCDIPGTHTAIINALLTFML